MLNYSKINNYLILLLIIFVLLFLGMVFRGMNNGVYWLAGQAIFNPEKRSEVDYQGKKYEITLPPKTVFWKENGGYKKFITLTVGSKLYKDYFYNELPSAGWKFKEQLGSGYLYTQDKMLLTATRQRIGWQIEMITYSINFNRADEGKIIISQLPELKL